MKTRALGFAVAFSALACGDDGPTEPPPPPPPPFEVEIDGVQDSFTIDAETGESRCEWTVTAQASGGGADAQAAWLDGTFEWWKDGDLVSDEYLSETELLDFWGSNRIRTGETQQFSRYTTWVGEYDLQITFRFELPGGELGSDIVVVHCLQ